MPEFSISEKTLFSRRPQTVEYRYANYDTSYNMFAKNSLFGTGYGTFLKEWSKYFSEGAFEVRELEDGNHSTLLGILAELGILGFVPYLGILVCALWVNLGAYRYLRGDRWSFERRFVVVGLAALEAFFLLGLTSDLRWDQMFDGIVFWLIGIVSSIHSHSLASTSDDLGTTSSLLPNFRKNVVSLRRSTPIAS